MPCTRNSRVAADAPVCKGGDAGGTRADARSAYDHSNRGRPRSGPQEARAMALHRVRGRGPRRLRACAHRGLRRRGKGTAVRRPARDRAHPAVAGADRRGRHLARHAQSGGSGVGTGAVLRGRVPEPVSGGQRDGVRHVLDHRVVRLQPRRALCPGAGREREGGRLHLHRHGQGAPADRERPELAKITSRWTA